MKRIPFTIEKITVVGCSDTAYLAEDDNPLEELKEAMWQAIRVDLNVTIGDTTMFAAAWEDPEHWASDWAEKLQVDYDEVPEAVQAILTEAIEGDE